MINASNMSVYGPMLNWLFDNPGDDFPQPPLSVTVAPVSSSQQMLMTLGVGA